MSVCEKREMITMGFGRAIMKVLTAVKQSSRKRRVCILALSAGAHVCESICMATRGFRRDGCFRQMLPTDATERSDRINVRPVIKQFAKALA
jgi:hypothetical protein